MNKAIIESIEWHKDQLFKLLEDDDLYKMEGSIHSAKTGLNEIIEKAKSKRQVWVKATAKKKGHYREMEVGRKEGGSDINSLVDTIHRSGTTPGERSDAAEQLVSMALASSEDPHEVWKFIGKIRSIADKKSAPKGFEQKTAKQMENVYRTIDRRIPPPKSFSETKDPATYEELTSPLKERQRSYEESLR